MSTEVLDRTEELLKLPRELHMREAEFHEAMLDRFVPSCQDTAGTFLETGLALLNELPQQELAELLASKPNKQELRRIRDLRKLVMIGRDTLLLCAESVEGFDSMFELTHHLGRIADTGARKRRHFGKCRRELTTLTEVLQNADLTAVDTQTVRARCAERMSSAEILSRRTGMDTDTFHGYRIGFRRVVHMGIISAIVDPKPEVDDLMLSTGFGLNVIYGNFVGELYHQNPPVTESYDPLEPVLREHAVAIAV